jgi:methylated-DNA-protein-cysteine methyltransferase related protein
MNETSVFERIYAIVRQVPPGQVVTYGQVAKLVGGISAQMVGFALAALRERSGIEPVPWQRVINAQGKVSPHGQGYGTAVQRQLLEEEGVVFDAEGRVNLNEFRWNLGG